LHGFKFGGRGIAGAGDLGLEFAIAGGVNVGERRAGGDESLGIGDAFCGAEDFQELIALAANTAEEARLLEDERPGDERREEKNAEDSASNPAGLLENIEDAADENGVQEKKNVCLLKKEKFLQGKFNVAQGWSMVKRNRMRMCCGGMQGEWALDNR
jgi:hypothetical protein